MRTEARAACGTEAGRAWRGVARATVAAVLAGTAAASSLQVTVPDGALAVGDRLHLRIAAPTGEDGSWGTPEVEVDVASDWAEVQEPRYLPGTDPPAWEVVLAPLAVGELELPPIGIPLRGSDGQLEKIRAQEMPTVTVASVLPPGGDAEPAPLRAPRGVSGFPWEWVMPSLVVLLPMLGLATWWWRRRRQVETRGAERRRLSPLAELEAEAAEIEQLVGRVPAAELCDRLAAASRRFLERRTGEPAAEMTSFELRVLGRRVGWPAPVRRRIQLVMDLADGVRFGRLPVRDDDLHGGVAAATAAARELVAHLDEAQAEREATA